MRGNFLLISSVLLFLQASVMATNTPETTTIDELVVDSVVTDAMKTFHVPGASMALVINNKTVLCRGYGVREEGKNAPVDEHTLFPIASCTKAFTAYHLTQLAHDGRIDLDVPVNAYIPELHLGNEMVTHKATLRDLLAHRTGIARHDPIWFCTHTSKEMLATLFSRCEPLGKFRTDFYYNNFLYGVAGLVIEKATGLVWEEALLQHVLNPLGMEASNCTLEALMEGENYAIPHATISRAAVTIPFRPLGAVAAGGGMNSSSHDMAKWLAANLESSAVTSSHKLQSMRQLEITYAEPTRNGDAIEQLGYGLGWSLQRYRGRSLVIHAGTIDGFASETAFFPDDGIGLVILTNNSATGHYFISAVRNTLLDHLFQEQERDWTKAMEELQEYALGEVENAVALYEKTKNAPFILDEFDPYVGNFTHPVYGLFHCELSHGALTATYGVKTFPLYCCGQDRFLAFLDVLQPFGIPPIIEITFIRNAAGEVVGLDVPFEAFRKLPPVTFSRSFEMM